MDSIRKAPLEDRLCALIDGELQGQERDELEAQIAADQRTRDLYETLRRGMLLGGRAFDDLLKEPVPLTLVRNIKNAREPDKTGRALQRHRQIRKLKPTGTQALAACLMLFVLGGALGYMAGVGPSSGTSGVGLASMTGIGTGSLRNWLDDIAAVHRVYSKQREHLAEVGATENDHIESWLAESTGIAFQIPDLADSKLEFQGARLVVAAGKPAAQLLYKDDSGDIIAICFVKDGMTSQDYEFKELIRDDIGMISWHKGAGAYVVVGPSSEASLTAIAEKVALTL